MAREPRTILRWRYSVCKDTGSSLRPGKSAGVSSAGSLLACTSQEALDQVLADQGLAEGWTTMETHSWFSGGLSRVRKGNPSGTELTVAIVLVVVTDPRADDPMREGEDTAASEQWRPGR